MSKTCDEQGCNQPVFSKKKCRYHWGKVYAKPLKQSNKPIKSKARVKPQRDEEKEVKVALSKLKNDIRLEAVQNNEYFCKGCGKGGKYLDCSHILAVGYRKDLELCKENIQLLCRRCHSHWESMDIILMMALDCFKSNLAFIKKHDTLMYRKLRTKMDYKDYDTLLKTERNEKGQPQKEA